MDYSMLAMIYGYLPLHLPSLPPPRRPPTPPPLPHVYPSPPLHFVGESRRCFHRHKKKVALSTRRNWFGLRITKIEPRSSGTQFWYVQRHPNLLPHLKSHPSSEILQISTRFVMPLLAFKMVDLAWGTQEQCFITVHQFYLRFSRSPKNLNIYLRGK